MARNRRNITPEEQLEQLSVDIENMEETLKEMKRTKKELESQIKMNKLEELYNIITSNGKTIDEVKDMLQCEESCA